MTQVIGAALQLGGMPVPVGGGVRLVDALAGIVTDAGGEVRLERRRPADPRRERARDRRALGDGEVVAATRAVVANVTPTQLYGTLLGGSDVPAARRRARRRGSATAAPRCRSTSRSTSRRAGRGREAERLARCPIVHVTPGLDGVSRAVNEAERGLLPGRGDDRLRPAGRARPVARAGGQVDPLDPAPGASGGHGQGRRGRRARHRRRHVDGGAARGIRRPDRRAARRVDREPRRRDPEARRRLPRRPRGAQPEPRRRRHLRRLVRARPEPALAPAGGGARATRPPSPGSGTSARARIPGPGLGAGSGYLVAKELTRPPIARRLLARIPGRS